METHLMTDSSARQSVLIVDDDEILRSRLERSFQKRGLTVYTAADREEALRVGRDYQPDMAVIDLKMPDLNGMHLLKDLLQVSPGTRAVILTGYGSIANAVEAIKMGAVNYVTKPADADQVLAAFSGEPLIESGPADELERNPPSLAAAQWEHIQRVLADCEGNISEAARRLDIPRRTLQRKLKKMAP